MSVSSPFIKRPIATSLLGVATMLGGLLGYLWLPVSSLPQVDFPTIQVTTQLPGASPDVMTSLVTAPLERNFGQIPALQLMTSQSSFGISQITLQFDLGREIDAAAQDVQAAINASGSSLPRNLPYPPVYSKVNPADAPIITLAITSETISLRALSDIADTLLGQRLSEVSGVGRVTVQGNIKPAIRIQADLARLANYGISLEELRNVIVAANVAGPKGALDGAHQSYTISANDQLTAAEAYRTVIITYRNGAPVLLKDVADIVDGLENNKVGGWYQGRPAIVIDIQRQPGANVIETVQRIQRELPKLQRSMPVGATLTVVHDATASIRASVRDVQFTLVLSVALVITVVLIFLRTVRATIIAGVTLPLSLVATFGIMWFCGFSLDNLSLMALTIGTGFVVDDAIVMIENIVRHMEAGEDPFEAALRGAREIGFTVISLTVSLIAVFIPLLFMTGLVGRMFREFALTLTIAVVTSAVVSLTLTPMMCSRLLRHRADGAASGRITRTFHGAVEWSVELYRRSLEWVLRHERLTLAVTAATLVATVWLYIIIPKGFLPLQDTGLIFAVMEGGQEISFTEMKRLQAAVEHAIRKDPEVNGVVSVIGVTPINATPNAGTARHHTALARRAQDPGDRSGRAPAAGRRPDPWRHRLLPAGAGYPDLDPAESRAIPVHTHRYRYEGGRRLGGSPDAAAAAIRGAARRGIRGAGRGVPAAGRGRPRTGRPPRHLDADRRRHLGRCLRPTSDFDHLRAGQPVSRDPRGHAALPERSGRASQDLRARFRHRSAGAVQLVDVDGRSGHRLDLGQPHGASERDRPLRAHDGAAGDRPSGAVSSGDDQLQPGAGGSAERRGPGDRAGRARNRHAVVAGRQVLPATPPSSAGRLPGSRG